MAEILVVRTSLFHDLGYFEGFKVRGGEGRDVKEYITAIRQPSKNQWLDRADAEDDPTYKQLIPYIVFHFGDQVFSYCRKKGGEKRLDGCHSIGIGGHIEKQDTERPVLPVPVGNEVFTDNFTPVGQSALPNYPLYRGLQREIEEEVEITCPFRIKPIGLLNDDSTEVGRVHLGVVFLATLYGEGISSRETEVSDACLISMEEIKDTRKAYEVWSQLIIDSMPKVVDDFKYRK